MDAGERREESKLLLLGGGSALKRARVTHQNPHQSQKPADTHFKSLFCLSHPRRRKPCTDMVISILRQWGELLHKARDVVPVDETEVRPESGHLTTQANSQHSPLLPGDISIGIASSHHNGLPIRNTAGTSSTMAQLKGFATWELFLFY